MAIKKQSLDSFTAEIEEDIKKFKAAYEEKHRENPEQYPLEIDESNAGVWFEFFIDYCQTGNV